MKLSYSNYKLYLDCPKLYKYKKDKVPTPIPDSKYFALYGIIVQKFLEYYTNYFLKQEFEVTQDNIKKAMKPLWDRVLSDNYVNWSDPWVRMSSDQIFEQACFDVEKNIKALDFFKHSKSEVSIIVKMKNTGDELSARVDFIVEYPNGDIEIIDGKGTNEIGKNVSDEQLLFYALVYYLHKKKFPKKLGFLYYQFQKIIYLDFKLEDIIAFKNKLAIIKKSIKADKEFKANVALSKHCKYCSYRFDCDGFNNKKEANQRKKDFKSQLESNGDITDISL